MDHLLEVPDLMQYNSNGKLSSGIYSMERISDRIKVYCNHKVSYIQEELIGCQKNNFDCNGNDCYSSTEFQIWL